MKRCTKCILPDNYPGITFNEEGICNYCISDLKKKERNYLGDNALKEKITQFLKNNEDRNKNYDCVLGFSGGRDSTYLLYYLVKKLNMKVLAYNVDNGFTPEQTKINMINATNILNVKLVVDKIDYLEKCFKHHIISWMHKPSLAMIETFCIGCRYGQNKGLPKFAKKNKIPIYIMGATLSEKANYKINMLKLKPDSKGNIQIIIGTLLHLAKNPKTFCNVNCLSMQIKEYFSYFLFFNKIKKKIGIKSNILRLDPFVTYKRWEEKEINAIIQNELKWKKYQGIESTWRGDCDIALIKLYMYKQILGFNDKDEGFSYLIRDNQINRDEALERIKTEGDVPKEIIKEIFDKYGLNFSDFEVALKKCEKV